MRLVTCLVAIHHCLTPDPSSFLEFFSCKLVFSISCLFWGDLSVSSFELLQFSNYLSGLVFRPVMNVPFQICSFIDVVCD